MLERFFGKVDDTGDCWEWIGSKSTAGYGTFNVGPRGNGKFVYEFAHRVSYEFHAGPIPEGLFVDHLCHNRACVNPAHLEPVAPRENSIRAAVFLRPTCPQGHQYNRVRNGSRRCSICDNANAMRRYHARKLVA
jgi:hypothetical protein